jgi:hypothetical protein
VRERGILESKENVGKLSFNRRDWNAHVIKLEKLGLTPIEAIEYLSEFMEAPAVQALLGEVVICHVDRCRAKRPLNLAQFYCSLKCADCSINTIYKQKLAGDSQLKAEEAVS